MFIAGLSTASQMQPPLAALARGAIERPHNCAEPGAIDLQDWE